MDRESKITGLNIRATGLKEFWSEEFPGSIYLWEGAKKDRPLGEIINDPVPTLEDIFQTQSQIQQSHDFCKSFYYRAIHTLSAKLNKIHGLQFSENFWRICFGQWLYRHIVVAYDKFFNLNRVDLDNIGIKLLDYKSFFIPKDHYEYILCFANDFGVQQLISHYFHLYSHKRYPNIEMPFSFQPINFCNLPEADNNNSPEVAMLGLFISDRIHKFLLDNSKGKIGNISIPQNLALNGHIDIESRSSLADKAIEKTFESYFFNSLVYCMPRDYIENFKIYLESFEADINSRSFHKLVVEAWISHIPSAIYAALAKEKKYKLICFEHGSGSVFYKNFPSRFVDIEVGDTFLSVGWGKTRGRFVKGGFAIRQTEPYQFSPEKKSILYISRTKSPYVFEFNEASVVNSVFVKELQLISDFIDRLPSILRNNFIFRPRGKDIFFWDTEATLELDKKKVTIDRDPDFSSSISRSRIVVIDHLSTGIAELLMTGTPFIILHAVSQIGCSEELREVFDELRNCGVVHENSQSAILHLTSIYHDVESWWNSTLVRSSILNLKSFSLSPESHFVDYLFSLISKSNILATSIDEHTERAKQTGETKLLNSEELFSEGVRFFNGDGVSQNYQLSADYLKKAALAGHLEAQAYLAGMYETGCGVQLDIDSAIWWYKKAATNGSVKAQLRLGVLYSQGQGVTKNHIESYIWFGLAAKNGDLEAERIKILFEQALPHEHLKIAQEAIEGYLSNKFS